MPAAGASDALLRIRHPATFNIERFIKREPGSAATCQQIYQDLHSRQFSEPEAANAVSAGRILDIVMDYLGPASVLDVGCGSGK
jgi:hypothetical protein